MSKITSDAIKREVLDDHACALFEKLPLPVRNTYFVFIKLANPLQVSVRKAWEKLR